MIPSPNDNAAAIALNRFGLGARPEDTPPADPKRWLLSQFDQYQPMPAAWAGQPGAVALATQLGEQRMQNANANANVGPASDATVNPADKQAAKQAANKAMRAEIRDVYRTAVNVRVNSALTSSTPFIDRLVHFWANHFAVSTEKPQVAALAGAFEMEAIRPHVLGRFDDMLVAVEQHPAMQIFLDQTRSVGPDSMAAMRAEQRNPDNKRGLNENLAREIMELHTLGVRSGYTQADVTEFARALTGWSVAGVRGPQPNGAAPGSFVFHEQLHEPGSRTILGRRYDQQGEDQALAVLHDFAASPATAQHIASKLARHFVSDNPPPAVTERLANAFERSGGDLPTVYRALIDSPEAWSPVAVKFKTPWEWTISSMRGLGWQDVGNLQGAPLLTQLGEPVWRPGSPAGYDDIAASWAAPDALVRRVEVAQRFAARVGDQLDPRTLGQTLLVGSISAPTATAVSRAESASTAIALLLVSPDFQRR
ncbi:DUF1800 domain-containing protein [Paraburkholderia phenazinium]|uniref:Uncharacterized conserved protein, DUF1800 family n=1 Tax=Paraburkholderia phenazinium TaxID=60549 RepID=A0A1N6JUY4_9BURK|nr:DUF1800 domain-containing protein [Paraburkholderia phenazinium]SIO48178.1 Uncharacterized conserved protein, DUF1800 family [Paraburkholderia phenazinium]